MISVAPPIGVADVPGGYLVSLPPQLALVLSLRASFRRVRAAAEPWTYFVPGPAMRMGEWLAEVELRALAERRRRAWSASDTEWDGAVVASAAPARPAPEPVIIRLPRKRTARPVMELLGQLAAGETMIAESGSFILFPSGRPVPAGAARRAIEQRLLVPSCDGLFGPDWSQSWRAPTQEETDAAADASGDRRPEGDQGRSRDRRAPAGSADARRPRRPARQQQAPEGVGDAGRRGPARRGGGVA
ncbi:MAG: hypothetical protein WAP03_13225 [Methylorubrum rhodinum]|uniref:hypothetical protein n=1 Tax=Methylorubrum rhodinum TaxID=29428 RepID=UPI003BB005B0